MTVTVSPRDSGAGHFAIEGEMTIYNALQLKETLLPHLDQSAGLHIDLAGVIEIDSSGLQLLLLLKNAARAQEKNLVISSHSQAVLEVLDLCNLEGFFGDPVLVRSREYTHGI